jgi:hypothetical protein
MTGCWLLKRALTASPLQSGLGLCLKRRIGGTLGSDRGVAQLVEYRSPKPVVAGSSPAAPASLCKYLAVVLSERSENVDPIWTQAGSGPHEAGRQCADRVR